MWLAAHGDHLDLEGRAESLEEEWMISQETRPHPSWEAGEPGCLHWEGRWVATPYLSSALGCLLVSPVVSHHRNTGYQEGKLIYQFPRTSEVPEAPGTVPFLSFSVGTHKYNASLSDTKMTAITGRGCLSNLCFFF